MSDFRSKTLFMASALCLGAFLGACATSGQAAQPTPVPQVAEGQRLFVNYCAACHSTLPDTTIVGPSLAGIAGTAGSRVADLEARAYLQQSIQDPQAYLVQGYKDLMPPNFAQTLDSGQIEALIAYLLTLD